MISSSAVVWLCAAVGASVLACAVIAALWWYQWTHGGSKCRSDESATIFAGALTLVSALAFAGVLVWAFPLAVMLALFVSAALAVSVGASVQAGSPPRLRVSKWLGGYAAAAAIVAETMLLTCL